MDRCARKFDPSYRLEDRYDRNEGRIFLSGTQALVRIMLDQARRDRAAGLSTSGFVSGYRGSPLGAFDKELWQAGPLIARHAISFLPAVNEDLAATAVLGSQQVETTPERRVQGVFAMWYGKGPGVDRSGDALRHGNAYGTSPHGGVLAVAGDDHGCVSSSMPHQSDVAFMTWFMPILNPASISDYLTLGEYGYALSRFSGMWVGFKAISETVEAAASVELAAWRRFETPDFTPPPGGLHYRWPDLPGPQIEERMEAKKHAVLAFAEANPVDRAIHGDDRADYGIVTTGKAHADVMEALRLLGLDAGQCRRIGIDIYKIAMVWPLARGPALDFVRHKQEVLVVEEKRAIVESQLKEYFYDHPGHKPRAMVGKRDENGERLVPWTGELSPRVLAPIIARRLDAVFPGLNLRRRALALQQREGQVSGNPGAPRTPYFCSGCPHNISTRVPEGSRALAGIGCHFMASWMDRDTSCLIQMGGEGVNWVGLSRFAGNGHIFQNLGEGTYYHSGSMAIRQAIAAKTNITYKILYNDAVAMTGGQPVDGPLSVEAIAKGVRAEGVARIALVSRAPARFRRADLPEGVTIHHRRELDAVQRQLREVPGVSVLIYEQVCASEERRRRKRGHSSQPERHVVINELVCEGCGDCAGESNCLSVEPVETPFGRKRRINASTCNSDFSCLEGFCPSFVTVEGASRRRHKIEPALEFTRLAESLAEPDTRLPDRPYDLLVTGVGGTGVVTIGALVAMAAHLEDKGVSVLDFTGFAQKFGPVMSYIRLARHPGDLNQLRIDGSSADALIGCDLVVSTSPKAAALYHAGTQAVVNTAAMPTGEVVRRPDHDLDIAGRLAALRDALGHSRVADLDANKVSEALFGDTVFANMIMLGAAWQRGLVPVGERALMQAVALNGVLPERNRQAFAAGRISAHDRDMLAGMIGPGPGQDTLEEAIARRQAHLTEYQDAAWAGRYRSLVEHVRSAESALGSTVLTQSVARSLFKLMAYKDEYEVGRLHMETGFTAKLREDFEDGFKLRYHLAPPLVPLPRDRRGRPRKLALGAWVRLPLWGLARLKRLRGTWLDPFGYSCERRMERALIPWYEAIVEELVASLDTYEAEKLAQIARLPCDIRGFGPVKMEAAARVRENVSQRMRLLQPRQGTR